MRKRTKIIIVGSILTVILAFTYWQPRLQTSQPTAVEYSAADYYFKQVTVKQFNENGGLINRLQAEKMEHFNRDNTSNFVMPKILFVSDSGKAWQVQSSSGRLKDLANRLELDDKTSIYQVDSTQKNIIRTANLLIDLDKKTATTESPVSIETEQSMTHARGMFADFTLQKIALTADVETLGLPNDKKQ